MKINESAVKKYAVEGLKFATRRIKKSISSN
jgi:hypothetical protein